MGCGASSAKPPASKEDAPGPKDGKKVGFAAETAVVDAPSARTLGTTKSSSTIGQDAGDDDEESEEDDVPIAAFGKARNSMWINQKKMGKDGNFVEDDSDEEEDPNFVNPHKIFGGDGGAPSPAAATPAADAPPAEAAPASAE